MKVGSVALGALLAAVCLAPRSAQAIPAFARKYGTACATCHDTAYPELGPFGRRFKENGYQYPAEAEAEFRAKEAAVDQTGEAKNRLVLARELPLAMRVQSTVTVPTDPQASGQNAVDFRMIDNLFLMAGGAVAPDISLFASTTLSPLVLHHAEVGFHNLLFGPGRFNVRAGRFLLLDFLRPSHRELTLVGNAGAELGVGLNPTVLDSAQHGFDLYGRVARERLFWELALVQGAQAADAVRDLDGYKDLFGQLQATLWERQTLGLLGYVGRTQLTDTTHGLSVRFTDPFWIAGASAELGRGPVSLFGYALRGHHDNPSGTGEKASYWSFRGQVQAAASRRWVFVGRYDQILSSNASALAPRQLATIHATAFVVANVRLSIESTAELSHINQSILSFRLDLAI